MQKPNSKWKWFIFCCCSNAEHLCYLFLSNEHKKCSEHILGHRRWFRCNCAKEKRQWIQSTEWNKSHFFLHRFEWTLFVSFNASLFVWTTKKNWFWTGIAPTVDDAECLMLFELISFDFQPLNSDTLATQSNISIENLSVLSFCSTKINNAISLRRRVEVIRSYMPRQPSNHAMQCHSIQFVHLAIVFEQQLSRHYLRFSNTQ